MFTRRMCFILLVVITITFGKVDKYCLADDILTKKKEIAGSDMNISEAVIITCGDEKFAAFTVIKDGTKLYRLDGSLDYLNQIMHELYLLGYITSTKTMDDNIVETHLRNIDGILQSMNLSEKHDDIIRCFSVIRDGKSTNSDAFKCITNRDKVSLKKVRVKLLKKRQNGVRGVLCQE